MEKNIAANSKKNPKAFWRYAQEKLQTDNSIPDLQSNEEDINEPPTFTKCDDEKAEILLDYFSSVFTLEPDERHMPHFEKKNYLFELDRIEIDEEIVLKKLEKS